MANTELIQVRIDRKLKKDIENVFQKIGFDTASAIRMFLKRVQREGDFPFDIRMLNDKTVRTINTSKNDRNLSKKYSNIDEMMKDILGTKYAKA